MSRSTRGREAGRRGTGSRSLACSTSWPFLAIALPLAGRPPVGARGHPGAYTIPAAAENCEAFPPDGLIETWQADPDEAGFRSPDDPRGARRTPAGFPRGFGPLRDVPDGSYHIIHAPALRVFPSPDGGRRPRTCT